MMALNVGDELFIAGRPQAAKRAERNTGHTGKGLSRHACGPLLREAA
jgi:hypothetical protein